MRDLSPLPFIKMHGLGNDFVILDLREGGAMPDANLARRIADRHRGVGFDQLAAILPPAGNEALARIEFLNADGSLAQACGNATRCIARLLMDETGRRALKLESRHALLVAEDAGGTAVRVNMGHPVTDWRAIPLGREVDTLHLPGERDACATGMGNPHLTLFVPSLDAVDLAAEGPALEHHPLYPERANVEFVEVLGRDAIRLGIWERGSGITLASGSCSCAAAVASARRGLTDRRVRVEVPGGVILIDWREDGVWMEGATARVFEGVLSPDWLVAG